MSHNISLKNRMDTRLIKATQHRQMISKTFMHSENRRLYIVTDLVWNSNDDTWMVSYKREGEEVTFVRSVDNFKGENRAGVLRFIQINEE